MIQKILPVAVAPLTLMIYGWYLGQLHQSGYDLPWILLFITGAIGQILAFVIRLLPQNIRGMGIGTWTSYVEYLVLGEFFRCS